LIVTTVLCKAASGWSALAIGCGGYFIYRLYHGNSLLILLLLTIPFYIGVRISDTIPMDDVVVLTAKIFDADRTSSLAARLLQEDQFIKKAMESPLFGWGGHSRFWPVDPYTGKRLIRMVDALWIITFGSKGFFGLGSLLMSMLIGPWCVLWATSKKVRMRDNSTAIPVSLSLIVVIFMIDSLFNAMVNPVYILISGGLIGWYLSQRQEPRLVARSLEIKGHRRGNITDVFPN
jgi:hypothetical protein